MVQVPSLPLVFSLLAVLKHRFAHAAASMTCCALLSQELPGRVHSQNTTVYEFERTDFWSYTAFLEPTCVFLPNNTQDVSDAVRLFSQNDCTFSIKGGGHSSLPGAANINDGIAIILKNLNERTIDFDNNLIRLGMGNRLGDVYRTLDPYNLSTVIGRYNDVGLGLAVGAGLSFFGNRDGLTVDNVLNFEVVLANGTVVETSTTEHAGLHQALKGGGNNFGVVTRINMATVRTPGGVYGGLVTYPESSFEQLSDVVYDYHTRTAVEDPLTHVLPQYGYNGTTNETINFSPVVYNDLVSELPASMSGWVDTPHSNSTLRLRNYSSLAVEYNAGFPNGLVQEQRTFTVYPDRDFFRDVWWQYRVWLQNYRQLEGFYGLHCNMPVTQHAIAEGVVKGGNALGHENSRNQTLSILYFGLTFVNPDDRDEVLADHDTFVKSMRAQAEARGILHPYIMTTYAGNGQPVMSSYGPESVQRMKEVQQAYDPTLVFQRLVTGGHKLPVQGTY